MRRAERNLERLLGALRTVIGERGFSCSEIEEALGWEAGRVEALLERREAIAVGEAVQVLGVLGVEPGEFFARVFPPDAPRRKQRTRLERMLGCDVGFSRERHALLLGLLVVLLDQGVLSRDELGRGGDENPPREDAS